MKRDFSKIPANVTITNTTENKIILELSDLSGVFEQVPATIEAGEVLVLNVETSEALAALTHRVEDAGIKMTVKESGGDEPEPEEPTEVATEEDLKQAIANGDKEVKLTDNITVASGNLNLGTTEHFDGNGKTISFGTTGQNLVSTHSGTTIENVTVENTVATEDWSSTYGIQCYNGDYTIRNCKVSNCNGGILVNSANVTLEGTIDVSNNKFGGIEVSKGSASGLGNATLNVNGATLVNTTEEYGKPTIWTDGEGNTVNGVEAMFTNSEVKPNQVQYYLEEENSTPDGMLFDGVVYNTLADAINAVSDTEATIKMYKDTTEEVTIPVGKTITVEGNNHILTGDFTMNTKGTGTTNLTLKDMKLVSDDTSFGIFSADQTETAGDVKTNVDLQNCTFEDYTGKAIYLTNAQSLNTNSCTFTNCATGPMNDPNTVGDYVVDLNLVGVQDTEVNIDNCTFNDNKAQKAVVKVAARGGASDADASDIPDGVEEATVSNLVLTNCTFTNNGETEVKDLNIGTTSKTEGEVENTTGAYTATISNNKTDVVVSLPYSDTEVTVEAGKTYTKTADGELVEQV